MESSSFIVFGCGSTISQPLSLALQKMNCDIVKAYRDAKLCKDTILLQRQESKFDVLWEKATAIADTVGVVLSKPRTVNWSRFRSNAGSELNDSDIEYYTIRSSIIVWRSSCHCRVVIPWVQAPSIKNVLTHRS